MPVLTQPLTHDELERPDDFLYLVNPGDSMSLEELDGYFCALICCPEVVPPSEYLPYVWRDEHVGNGAFKSVEEAQEILTLISRHWNTIAATLLRDEPYPVLMGEDEDGKMTGQEWALGFQQGMFLRQEAWERLANDEKLGAALLPVIVLAEGDEHQLTADPVTQEERDAMLDVLAESVLIIYRYFRNKAKPQRRAKIFAGRFTVRRTTDVDGHHGPCRQQVWREHLQTLSLLQWPLHGWEPPRAGGGGCAAAPAAGR